MASMATSAYLGTTVSSCSCFQHSSFVGTKNVDSVTSIAGGLRLPSLNAARGPAQKKRSLRAPSALFGTNDQESVLAKVCPIKLFLENFCFLPTNCCSWQRIIDRGNNSTGDGDSKKADKRKFITKEQEPEQYWQTADEREGKNPMATPLPYILILSVLSPFIILAVAFANNWIKIPVR
ncbi:hypothetical protein R1sor_016144 [Riccia sorocarpa]|uniref:Uncharacterized protein n=1 Tax=Riccia sorocarpa TaxID=122646 RepID=A0ABD3HE58_9MARC